MLRALKTGFLIDAEDLSKEICSIESLLQESDVSEFIDSFGEGKLTFLSADKVSEFYELNFRTNCNIYFRMALLAARTVITMFEERLLPEEGVYVIDFGRE